MGQEDEKPQWKSLMDEFRDKEINSHDKYISNKNFGVSKSNPQKDSNSENNNGVNPKTTIRVLINEDGLIHIKPMSKQLSTLLSKHPKEKVSYVLDKSIWTVTLDFYEKIHQDLKKNFKFNEIPIGVIKTLIKESFRQENKVLLPIEDPVYKILLPYQSECVKYAISKNGRILIADEMGLGKTYQALAISYFYKNEFPLLIIAPASLTDTWLKAIKILLNLDCTIVRDVYDLEGNIIIISYDLASKYSDEISKINFQVVIVDECHYLKGLQTKRSQNLIKILQDSKRLILLSGTPALSRPVELYNCIIALNKCIFKNRTEYGYRYCNLRKIGDIFDWRGSSNCEELYYFLTKCLMIRRLKSNVLYQLPKKHRHQIILNCNKSTLKKSTIKSNDINLLIEDTNKKQNKVSDDIMTKYRKAAEIKIEEVQKYIIRMLERDEKIIIFGYHMVMIDALEETLSAHTKFIRIDGKTPVRKRNQMISDFQEDDNIKVALLGLTACSAGLTLTAANLLIFAELYWNPGTLLQAEDRIHRIGQKKDVNIHYLIAKGTIDEQVWPLLLKKLQVLEKMGIGSNELKNMKSIDSNQGVLEDFKLKKCKRE